MKKSFSALLCGFIIAGGLFASENSFFSFNITPQIGLMNGTVREYVIDPECTNTGNKESQLDWDIKNIPVISADADFWFFKYFYANLNFRSGFPKASGVMQDYDWLNSITTGWLKDDPTELTNYSISDNQLDSYYSFGLKLGGSINLPLRIKILPFISFEYDYLSMSSYGGYALYKQDNWNVKYFVDSDGNAIKVISYQQEYNAFILGLKVQSEAIPRTYISAEYMISPYTSDITALDIHAIRFIGFLDKMPKSMMMKASAEIMYKINQLHRVGLSAFIHYIPFTSGPDCMAKVNANGKAYTSYQSTGVDGGTDRFLWQLSLVYQFLL